MSIKRITVATDFSSQAARALETGCDLAKSTGAHLDLVHVCEPVAYAFGDLGYGTAEWVLSIEKNAAEQFEKALKELVQRVPGSSGHFRRGVAWQEIVAAADDDHSDLIVMGTHGRRGVSRVLLGSVADRVVRVSKVPVLVVPPAGE